MNLIRAITGFFVTIGLAVLLGYTNKSRSHATIFYSWTFAVFILLFLRWCF